MLDYHHSLFGFYKVEWIVMGADEIVILQNEGADDGSFHDFFIILMIMEIAGFPCLSVVNNYLSE